MTCSHTRALSTVVAVLTLTACLTGAAWGLVNPRLQPSDHIFPHYVYVLGAQVSALDMDKRTITLKITRQVVGKFEPKEVVISVPQPTQQTEGGDGGGGTDNTLLEDTDVGQTIVAFVKKARRTTDTYFLLYANHWWHEGHFDANDIGKWTWEKVLNDPVGDDMYGTFNGSSDRLLEMMSDTAEGRQFFPAVPFTKFIDGPALPKLAGPCRGVAMYDFNGDGKLDLYVCSPAGDRLFVQVDGNKFEDRTAALGLDGARSASVGVADANADGKPDLLLDSAIWLQGADGKFAKSDLLPAEAAKDIKCSSFADVNADGYPDVIVSHNGGGLAIYLNGGAKGIAFADASAAAGLDKKECGAGGTGFFAWGDFNGDGRLDLYYGVGDGLILVQDAKGAFAPLPSKVRFNCDLARGPKLPGMTGAGAFASLWRADSFEIAAAGDMQLTIAGFRDGQAVNLTGFGNETQDCVVEQLGVLTEDLNMDGYVDLLTITRGVDSKNRFHTNRGYGSYMVDTNYATHDVFPDSFDAGAWGAAAGDVNGDGCNDLLLGGVSGQPVLLINDTFSLRKPTENPTWHDKKLSETRLLSVSVSGKLGVTGALVTLLEQPASAGKEPRVALQRVIGSQVLTGCRGPDAVNLAVRESGKYTLRVRFTDGKTATRDVDLTGAEKLVKAALSYDQAK